MNYAKFLTYVLLEFLCYRFILVMLGSFITHHWKKENHFYHELEMTSSILLYILFTFVFFRGIYNTFTSFEDIYTDIYVLYVIYAVFSVLWAYFSWDMDHWKSLPTFAKYEDVIIKKGILYTIVFILCLVIGYEQATHVTLQSQINPMYNIANISIIACIIALDRVVNQIYLSLKQR